MKVARASSKSPDKEDSNPDIEGKAYDPEKQSLAQGAAKCEHISDEVELTQLLEIGLGQPSNMKTA